jgi:hypothetical protein
VLRDPSHHLLLLPDGADPGTLGSLSEIGRRVEESYPGVVKAHLIASSEAAGGGGGAGSAWVDPGSSVRGLLGARETALAVVRPDGYLGYRGQPATWEEVQGYLDRYLIARPG